MKSHRHQGPLPRQYNKKDSNSRGNLRRFRPRVEALESREVPSANLALQVFDDGVPVAMTQVLPGTFVGTSAHFSAHLVSGSSNSPGTPALASLQLNDQSTIQVTAPGAHTLVIELTDIGFTNPPGSPLILSSSAGGEVITDSGDVVTATYQGVLDPTNLPFGNGSGVALGAPPAPNPAYTSGVVTATASGSNVPLVFAPGTASQPVPSSTPFALTGVATFHFSSAVTGDFVNIGASTAAGPSPVASPAINTVAGSSVVIGSGAKLTDTAVLSGGNNPTGTITFTLTGPGNTVVDTETVPVSGNGSYSTPTGYLPTATGTYLWTATYSGDSNNNSATDNGQNENETVTPAGPAINTVAGGTVVIGSGAKLTDTAVLSGGYSPTGTITFTLTGPGNTVVDTETVPVSGNGTYTTPTGYLPTATGTYLWSATYSGDSNNGGATDNGQNENETVTPATPAITTTPGQQNTTTGGAVGFATIGFWHNQNGQAVITNFDTGAGSTLLGNSLAGSYPKLFGAANPYVGTSLAGLTNAQVAAAYLGTWTPSGLQKNTYVQAFAVALGSYASGGAGTFNVGSNGAAFGVANNTTLSVGAILTAANNNFNPATGTFYGGDSTKTSALNNVLDGINTSGEAAGGTVVSTTTQLMDSATLSGGVNPTGTITFYLMAPGATASTPLTSAVYSDTVTVSGDGTYTTAAGTNPGGFTPIATGTYQWVAVYSGDANNNSVTSPFGSEPWVVGTQTPTITTVPTPNSVTLGTSSVLLKDTATLQDATNPTGTITFTLYSPTNVLLDTETVAVSGNGNYTTPTGYTLPANAATGTYQWNATYSGDGNNAPASDIGDKSEQVTVTSPPAPPPVPVGSGEFATIGFWHNKNGQAVINSFNGGSSATQLGNWLATNFPHLFGASNPYDGATLAGLPGHPTSLAGLTNAQVASVYLNLWNPSGVTKNTYVQAFAVALGMYADSSGLGYNSTAAKYGFKSVSGGGGSLTYNVGSNGAAFGVPNGTSLSVLAIMQAADAAFTPSTGVFFGGDQAKTSALNNVLNGINTNGDIALVNSDTAVAPDSQPLATALHPMDTGTMVVAVDALTGPDAAGEQARIDDAIAKLNATLAGFGLTLVEETGGDDPNADIHLHLSATSAIGGVADGVLGVTQAGGQITIITGWNYFTGSDAAGMAAGQYDFETVVMHELGHAVGLGHSTDGGSVMYPSLGTDQSRRLLTDADLAVIEQAEDGSPEPLLAAGFTAPGVPAAAAQPAVVASPVIPAAVAAPVSAPAATPAAVTPAFSAPVFVGDTAPAPVAAPAAFNIALLPPVGTTLPAADSGPAADEFAFSLPAGAPTDEAVWGKDWLFDGSSPFGDGGGAGAGADGEDADAGASDAMEEGDLVLSGVAVDGE